jgi:deaminated glutathione amidase
VIGLQKEAKRERLSISVGIHEPAESGSKGNKKVKNTSIWIDEDGAITQRYQKIHLFDLEIEGGPILKESNSVEKGMSILPPFETVVGRVGMTICFDVSNLDIHVRRNIVDRWNST